jgi:predicted adenylyl cyclase CyaB
MPTNIEIKACVRDFKTLQERAEALSDTPCQVIPQEDTFFYSPHGRLKLRVLAPDRGQLVYYIRPDASGPKRSEYHIYETSNPDGLKSILAAALGVRGVVAKIRYLYLAGQTRIHLDDVKELGQFMELEVVMRPGQDDSEGQAIAEDLMQKLGIHPTDLIDHAYMDMLEK